MSPLFFSVMDGNDYFIAGLAIAASLVHGGPAPHFLSKSLYQALVSGPDNVDVDLHSMPECQAKRELEQVH